MTGLSTLPTILFTLFVLVFTSGCGADGALDETNAFGDVTIGERMAMDGAEGMELRSEADATDTRVLELSLESMDADEDASEPGREGPCYWALAYVTIGDVTVVQRVLVCTNTVWVEIPTDPALIGLTIHIEIPGVGQATGTIQ